MDLAEVEFSESMYMPGDVGGESFRHYISGKHVDSIEMTEGCVIMRKSGKLRNYALWFVKSWTVKPKPELSAVSRRRRKV